MNKKNRKLEPKNLIQLFLGIIPFLILTITFSCEEDPSELGSKILPESDKLGYSYDTSLTFNGYIFENDPISVSNLSHYSLGILDNEYFGLFKGEYIGQFLPAVYDTSILQQSIDSAVLFLEIDSIYGNPFIGFSFDVFELISEIDEDSAYYSDADISHFYSPSEIINASSNISGDTLVELPLSSSFIEKLMSVEDSIYKSSANFKSVFNGIAIIPNSTEPPGGVLYTNISSTGSKIVLYYNDSLSFSYYFTSGHRFAKYTNDYSTSIVNDYLTNPDNENDDLLFIQGVNGVLSKIKFTNINPWIEEDSSYSILNAELIVPVFKDDNFELFYPPEKLFFYYSDPDSSLYQIDDYTSGGIFDGTYNSTENYYHFNISKHLMRMLKGDIVDSCLNFSIVNRSSFPHRVILESGENIKLNVTYTKH